MGLEKPQSGPWGRKLWNGVAILTAIGLLGPVIVLMKWWPALQADANTRCGNADLTYGLIQFLGACLVVLAGLAALGLLMFWLRSPAGPLLLLVCNLLMMAFYGFAQPVQPGELVWAVVIVGIAAAPAIASALALWPLVTRWALWVRILEFVIIAAIALPVAWLFGYGVTNDIRTALTTPPPPPVYLSAPHGPPQGCAGRLGSI